MPSDTAMKRAIQHRRTHSLFQKNQKLQWTFFGMAVEAYDCDELPIRGYSNWWWESGHFNSSTCIVVFNEICVIICHRFVAICRVVIWQSGLFYWRVDPFSCIYFLSNTNIFVSFHDYFWFSNIWNTGILCDIYLYSSRTKNNKWIFQSEFRVDISKMLRS